MKNDAVFALFHNSYQVRKAEQSLLDAGFLRKQISILVPPKGTREFNSNQNTRVLSGAEIGAAIGLVLGVTVGFLFGSQEISIPWLQSILSLNGWSGSVIGAVFGLTLGASSGALVGIGTPESGPERFGHYVDDGGVLLSVHADNSDQSRQASEVLERSGGNDITSMNERKGWTVASAHIHHTMQPQA